MVRVLAPRSRRRTSPHAFDDDAIWRGEVPDSDIVLTAAEHAALRQERLRRNRRRSLIEVFGEPVGLLSSNDAEFTHRRRGDGGGHGAPLDQQRMAGCREEIQVTVLAHPVHAGEAIAAGDLFSGCSGVVVDETSEQTARKQLAWEARLSTSPWTRRRARLRLYGSPSSNVTVLTLTPVRSRRRGAKLFLRAGLRSMFQLRDAIESQLTS